MDRSKQWTDERVEKIVGVLLRSGVIIAALVVFVGAIVYLIRNGGRSPHYEAFLGEPEDLRTIPGILKGVLSLRGRSVIQFGLLLLVATPVARVAFAVAAFGMERDRVYVIVTLVVLALLLFSLIGGGL